MQSSCKLNKWAGQVFRLHRFLWDLALGRKLGFSGKMFRGFGI